MAQRHIGKRSNYQSSNYKLLPEPELTSNPRVVFAQLKQQEEHMFKKYMTAGIVGSALLASAAFAQSPSATTSTTTPAAAPVTASNSTYNGNWRASKVVGLSVYNEANESLGSINDLLTDKEGNIKAVVIGVGGFLGVGEHLIAVPYDKIKFVNEPVATTSASATGAKSTTSSGMTTGAATTGAAPAATATPAKPNPWYPDHAVLGGASKDQLKAMPEFKYAT
jgi:sporulation protein YlmC with PRC-barrel domain